MLHRILVHLETVRTHYKLMIYLLQQMDVGWISFGLVSLPNNSHHQDDLRIFL